MSLSLKHENIFLRRKRYLNTLKEDLKKIKLKNTGVLRNCSSCRYYPIKISCRLNFDNLSMLLTSFSKYYQSDNKLYKYYTIR